MFSIIEVSVWRSLEEHRMSGVRSYTYTQRNSHPEKTITQRNSYPSPVQLTFRPPYYYHQHLVASHLPPARWVD